MRADSDLSRCYGSPNRDSRSIGPRGSGDCDHRVHSAADGTTALHALETPPWSDRASDNLHAVLRAGADIDARDADGHTPLMLSVCTYGRLEGAMHDNLTAWREHQGDRPDRFDRIASLFRCNDAMTSNTDRPRFGRTAPAPTPWGTR